MLKFIAAIVGKWRKPSIGKFQTAPVNFFDSTEKIKVGDSLPIECKVKEAENQFAWIVQYEKT